MGGLPAVSVELDEFAIVVAFGRVHLVHDEFAELAHFGSAELMKDTGEHQKNNSMSTRAIEMIFKVVGNAIDR